MKDSDAAKRDFDILSSLNKKFKDLNQKKLQSYEKTFKSEIREYKTSGISGKGINYLFSLKKAFEKAKDESLTELSNSEEFSSVLKKYKIKDGFGVSVVMQRIFLTLDVKQKKEVNMYLTNKDFEDKLVGIEKAYKEFRNKPSKKMIEEYENLCLIGIELQRELISTKLDGKNKRTEPLSSEEIKESSKKVFDDLERKKDFQGNLSELKKYIKIMRKLNIDSIEKLENVLESFSKVNRVFKVGLNEYNSFEGRIIGYLKIPKSYYYQKAQIQELMRKNKKVISPKKVKTTLTEAQLKEKNNKLIQNLIKEIKEFRIKAEENKSIKAFNEIIDIGVILLGYNHTKTEFHKEVYDIITDFIVRTARNYKNEINCQNQSKTTQYKNILSNLMGDKKGIEGHSFAIKYLSRNRKLISEKNKIEIKGLISALERIENTSSKNNFASQPSNNKSRGMVQGMC